MSKPIQILENICRKMGEGGISPAFVSSSIAAAKGVFRPIFTMADTKEKPETKKYTALREFLTEFIAIPVYLASGKLADWGTKKLATPEIFSKISKNASKNLSGEALTKEMMKFEEALKFNLGFLGVGLAALLVIPALASVVIKPLMRYIQPKTDSNTVANRTPITRYDYLFVGNKYNSLNSFPKTMTHVGMKVGGV